MRAALIAALLAACGNDHAAPVVDAPAPADAPLQVTCRARFHGNLADDSTGSGDCATLGSDGLAFSIAEPALAIPLAVAIGVGADPAVGLYSSETVQDWSVDSYERDTAGGGGACLYSAGGSATPPGSFTMTLTAVDAAAGVAHGSLSIAAWVLVFPGTHCGTDDMESIELTF